MGQYIEMFRLLRGVGGYLSPHLLIDLLLALMLETRFRGKMMKFYASCAPLRPAIPFGAYLPHPAHIEMH